MEQWRRRQMGTSAIVYDDNRAQRSLIGSGWRMSGYPSSRTVVACVVSKFQPWITAEVNAKTLVAPFLLSRITHLQKAHVYMYVRIWIRHKPTHLLALPPHPEAVENLVWNIQSAAECRIISTCVLRNSDSNLWEIIGYILLLDAVICRNDLEGEATTNANAHICCNGCYDNGFKS